MKNQLRGKHKRFSEGGPNMWDVDHQKRHIERSKRHLRYIDWMDLLVMGILKHLVHIFVVVIACAFVAMGVLLVYGESLGNDKYAQAFTNTDGGNLTNLLSSHPMLVAAQYGEKKVGLNLTGKLAESIGSFVGKNSDV